MMPAPRSDRPFRPEPEGRRIPGRPFDSRVLDELPIPLLVLRADRSISLVNRAFRELIAHYGYTVDDIASGDVMRFIADADRETAEAALRTAFETGRSSVEAACVTAGGQPVPFAFSNTRIASEGGQSLVVIATDLTDHRSLVQRLVHAQKMESLGRLAGGVAHDFNNLLVAVMSFTEVALLDTPADDPRREDLESIREAVLKAAELTRMLLAFGRRQLLMPKRVDLNAQLLDLDKMLRRMIGEDIELVVLPGAEIGPVRVDPGQLESALLALAVNARDAMPDGGTLTIATSRVEAEGRGWSRVTVADTGTGILPEVRARLFEPFHSTKDGNTGLGLASVHGFVEQSGGRIDVQTRPGAGTTFVIDLPEMEDESAEGGPARVRPAAAAGETVLLAEDNPRARRGIAAMLRAMGYTVLEAGHGEEALEVAEAHDGPIALLLSDVVMPRMKVTTLVERMRELRPETRVLLMSGYTDDALVRAGVQAGAVAFLPKPFTAEVLAAKIGEILD